MAVQTKRFINSRKSCSCSMPGVWRAVAYAKGAVVIFHSPKACSHVARRMDLSSYYLAQASNNLEDLELVPLLSSQLEERHSIFGGGERLEECMAYAVQQYKPDCLVVASSCVAGVIGDDMQSLCLLAEKKYGIPVITVDSYGFLNGEYYQGYYETAKAMMKRFMQPQEKIKDTVLLVGDAGGPWGDYAKEAGRLLGKFGLRVIGQFPGYTPIREMAELTQAEYIVPLGKPGQTDALLTELVALMAERYGFKYVPNKYPLGLTTTLEWLRAWGTLLGKPELAEQLCQQEEQLVRERVKAYLPVTKGKRTVFAIGRYLEYFHPGEILEMLELLGVELEGVVLLDAYDKKSKQAMLEVLQSLTKAKVYTQEEAEELLQGAELVLTTHELKLPGVKQIFIPMVPKVGSLGTRDFMQVIYRLLCSRIKNGGVTYVRS